jgi:hypothetical protein
MQIFLCRLKGGAFQLEVTQTLQSTLAMKLLCRLLSAVTVIKKHDQIIQELKSQ